MPYTRIPIPKSNVSGGLATAEGSLREHCVRGGAESTAWSESLPLVIWGQEGENEGSLVRP